MSGLRWFKVWSDLPSDPLFLDVPMDAVGRWTILGATIASHGERGSITCTESSLAKILRCDVQDVQKTLATIPNITTENDNGVITVIMRRWAKDQMDSTGYARLKKHRSKRHDNGLREEKEKTKKRQREERNDNGSLSEASPLEEEGKKTSGEITAADLEELQREYPSKSVKDINTKYEAYCVKIGRTPTVPGLLTWVLNERPTHGVEYDEDGNEISYDCAGRRLKRY